MTASRPLFGAPVFGALLLLAGGADAAVIGVVAPQQGPYALLGQQILHGARAAAEVSGDQIIAIHETCEQGQGAAVATQLQAAGASVAVGFLCVETVADSLAHLKAANIPVLSVAVRSKILMEDASRYGWPFFRLAPVDGMEAHKLSQTILTRWQNRPIALVDDGTIYGRELVGAVRQQLESGGIKPVFTDTFRPGQEQQLSLVRRLVGAGASHVIVGGDRNDVAVMARDAVAEKAPLTFVGGDVMRAANRPMPLADGTMAVAIPDYPDLAEAAVVVKRMRDQGTEADGYTLPAYAAVQVAQAAIRKAEVDKRPVTDMLPGLSVETVIGTIALGPDHELSSNPFRLQEWRDRTFRLVDPVTE